MKRKLLLLAIVSGFFSSSFFAGEGEVDAKACNGGSYYSVEEQKCKPLSKSGDVNENALKAEVKKMSDGSDLGTSWTHKFGRFMIILSVGVSYATQVFAALTIVYSAYLYTTSDGDLNRIKRAKQLILFAFSGMFIATFALIIVKMLGGAL